MNWNHKYSDLDNRCPITRSDIEKRKGGSEHRFADITFFEFNERRADGLFRKYVFAFNENGLNITSFIRLYLDKSKYSKQRKFNGALISGGLGFSYSSYLMGDLEKSGYKNFERMLYDLMVDGKISPQV